MIVVLLGTNPYSFERLVKAVDAIAEKGEEEFFVQLGNTPYEPRYCPFVRFIMKESLEAKIREATVVITHGGFGSIRDALAKRKPVIAVPRMEKFGECMDRQMELVSELEKAGRILAVYDVSALHKTIGEAKNFVGREITPNRIPQIIAEFLGNSFAAKPMAK